MTRGSALEKVHRLYLVGMRWRGKGVLNCKQRQVVIHRSQLDNCNFAVASSSAKDEARLGKAKLIG